MTLGITADDGVPVVGKRVGDTTEDGGGIREATGGGRGGAEIKEFCAGRV